MRNDVQVILYSFSVDGENPIDVLCINAASAALMISDAPWNGPVGAVRIGRLGDEFIVNPTFAQMAESDLDLRLAGTREAILMVECGAKEIPEDVMAAALEFGHRSIQPLIDVQLEMAAQLGKAKREYPAFTLPEGLFENVKSQTVTRLNQILDESNGKVELYTAVDALEVEILTGMLLPNETGELLYTEKQIKEAYHDVYKAVVRQRIIERSLRPDGRNLKEVRPIWGDVDISPRAHGSGLFTRGETQVLTLATLGTPKDAQEIDSLSPINEKRYMHHYNFPPFSTGEVRNLRGQS